VNEKSCDVIGCKNPGGYEAPKSPNSKEKYSFCLSHVKEYNKRWNFFAGKSQSQIHDYQKNDFFIGRPTRPFSKGVSSKIKFEFEYYFDNDTLNFERIKENKNTNFNKKISTEIKRCLKIFDIRKTKNIILSHEPVNLADNKTLNICGHYHPKLYIKNKGDKLSFRCFAMDKNKNTLFLPAFGDLTGGYPCKKSFKKWAIVSEEEIIEIKS